MKYYKEYIAECKANDILKLYDQGPDIALNEFDKFDEFLFTPEEMNDPLKFRKFIWLVHSEKYWEFMAPIDYPCTIEEYQINHYALWNAIAAIPSHTKPIGIASFNNSIKWKTGIPTPLHICYCCDFVISYDNKDNRFEKGRKNCCYCPIWGISKQEREELFEKGEEGEDELYEDAPCEESRRGISFYEDWKFAVYSAKRGMAASDLAKVEWRYDILDSDEDDK